MHTKKYEDVHSYHKYDNHISDIIDIYTINLIQKIFVFHHREKYTI